MDDEVADLLGFERPERPKIQYRPGWGPHGRRTKASLARTTKAIEVLDNLVAQRRQERPAPEEQPHMTVADVYHGVTVSWLAQVFSMDPGTVKKRLKDCPPLHRRKTGFVYDLKAAAPYLVQPKVDIESYLKTMKVSELPTHLQEGYWSAMTKRQTWEERAGQLWRTEAVLEVLGDVFQTIKFTMQLWPDNIERMTGLSPQQREMLTGMCDEMQKELHSKLVEMPARKRTASSLADAEATGLLPPPEAVDDDDDYTQLI